MMTVEEINALQEEVHRLCGLAAARQANMEAIHAHIALALELAGQQMSALILSGLNPNLYLPGAVSTEGPERD